MLKKSVRGGSVVSQIWTSKFGSIVLTICIFGVVCSLGFAQVSKAATAKRNTAKSSTPSLDGPAAIGSAAIAASSEDEKKACLESLNLTVRNENREKLKNFCNRISQLPSCTSAEGRAIFHADSSSPSPRGKRILVLGLIHGDEPLAGEMALEWAERLQTIEHRNSWRVLPMLNPDGLVRKTRTNANGIDLNRNFPTKDWANQALAYWKKSAKQDPRRFPGEEAASEPETKCAIAQIKDFKPDFIISVHTPYKVLDFDGPAMNFPAYKDLPWRALGNFPGSLGRFMWKDYSVPVLTVELGSNMVDVARLQDIVGTFAIEASKRSGQKTASLFDKLL
jgi:hypothetical protein